MPMLPINSTVELGHRALFHTRVPPRGTGSRIISLRLQRRSRAPSCISRDNLSQWQNTRRASTTASANAISDHEFLLFRDLVTRVGPKPRIEDSRRDATPSNTSFNAADTRIAAPSTDDPVERLPDPLRRALEALRRRDTERLILHLQHIVHLSEAELRGLAASLPRTTFTEFLRSLDPLCVARDVDPTGHAHITTGVYQMLSMESVVDDWGVRQIYSRLLRCMLVLGGALKASGQALQVEEYIYLLRCAGAASDPAGAKLIWDELRYTQSDWRHGEVFTEFVSARFLARPLYTGHDKIRRMVIPRNLHRSRLRLTWRQVGRLDRLRFNTRLKRLRFGLSKDLDHAEDLMRRMRKKGSPRRMLSIFLEDGYRISESLLCALMVAYGRAGSLRFVGSRILNAYFGIRMRRLTYTEAHDSDSNKAEIDHVPFRIRPTVRLMQAVVETYGSNGEIAIAFQLLDHISKTYHITIPLSIWQDLLEWTYIMGSSAVSAAWKEAKMYSKIPHSSSVEMIWNAMASAPYHIQPGFDQYNIIIRSLLGRHKFGAFLPLMRDAVHIYNAQCREYEEAVLEYVQMIRDGARISEVVSRYERARFRKAKMHHDIQLWCRKFLSDVRSFDSANPLAVIAVPDFIRDFGPFIPNPARYRTATGYVSLYDPARERPIQFISGEVPMAIPMKHKTNWIYQTVKPKRFGVLSENSLAGKSTISRFELVTLLTSTSRRPSFRKFIAPDRPPYYRKRNRKMNPKKNPEAKRSESTKESSYDDDDDYF
ncbi:N-acetylglucosaminyl-phosphatidylinositol de-N-acetylase [Hypoxylon texense]